MLTKKTYIRQFSEHYISHEQPIIPKHHIKYSSHSACTKFEIFYKKPDS